MKSTHFTSYRAKQSSIKWTQNRYYLLSRLIFKVFGLQYLVISFISKLCKFTGIGNYFGSEILENEKYISKTKKWFVFLECLCVCAAVYKKSGKKCCH